MNIAIIGYGSQGASAYNYWQDSENSITICDSNRDVMIPEGASTQLGEDYLKNLDKYDLIVRSPSIHPKNIISANPDVTIQSKVTTNTNEFFRVCPTKNIIGVTGTKGKGTTSTLITKMLEASGYRVHLGGNIGTPPLEMLKNDIKPDDWVVLELANFQLIDLLYSPHIAVCLMITSEHQDWHTDFNEYTRAKQQLFTHQTQDDYAIYYAFDQNSRDIASVSKAKQIPYMEKPGAYVVDDTVVINDKKICVINDIKLLGKHNLQNICSAITAVWQVSPNVSAIKQAIVNFSGMEYRLELIRELDGVSYYNDSFGTTPETAIVAIQAFDKPKILIAGGSDKSASYTELAQVIASNNVKTLITIGITGKVIAELVKSQSKSIKIIENPPSMQEAVELAQKEADTGDIVLLSTGSASFGMFENYKDRGDQFNQAVKGLAPTE